MIATKLAGACYVVLLTAAGCDSTPETDIAAVADRVYLGGAIYTVDAERSWAEAVAISSGRIVFVGSDNEAQAWVGEQTELIDLDGRMMLPGFHDSHTHILIGVFSDENCDVLRIEPREAVEAALAECTGLKGFGEERWIIGGGWGEWLFPLGNPDKALLDELFPHRPVYLESSYGHSAWVNSRALEIAGVHDETTVGKDGIIVRDPETGEATGTLHDSAMLLIRSVIPKMTMDYRLRSIRAAIQELHSFGITAVIEPGLDEELITPLVLLADAGDFDVRALTSLSPINWQPGVFDDGVFEFLEQRGRSHGARRFRSDARYERHVR